MLMNFETRDQIKNPGPVNGQEQSPFFQKLIPDVRRLIYLEVFGSRSVHVATRGLNVSKFFLYTCQQPDDAPPHSECPDVGEEKFRLSTNLLYTCQMAYNEGAKLLFKSNKFLFSDQVEYCFFFHLVPDIFQNSVRSLDICVKFHAYDIHLIKTMCKELSNWTGDFELRIRWDMDHPRRRNRENNFNTVVDAIYQLIKNPRVRPKFWGAPKTLEDAIGYVLKKEDSLRLEFVRDENQPDPNDDDNGEEDDDDGEEEDDEDEDEDEDEYDWEDDSEDYDEYDSEGTDVIHDDEETLRYWEAIVGQA